MPFLEDKITFLRGTPFIVASRGLAADSSRVKCLTPVTPLTVKKIRDHSQFKDSLEQPNVLWDICFSFNYRMTGHQTIVPSVEGLKRKRYKAKNFIKHLKPDHSVK